MNFLEDLYVRRIKKEKELKEINKEIYFFEIIEEQNKIKNKILYSDETKLFDILYLAEISLLKRKSDDWFPIFMDFFHLELIDNLDESKFIKLIKLYSEYGKCINLNEEFKNAKTFYDEKVLRTSFRPKL